MLRTCKKETTHFSVTSLKQDYNTANYYRVSIFVTKRDTRYQYLNRLQIQFQLLESNTQYPRYAMAQSGKLVSFLYCSVVELYTNKLPVYIQFSTVR